MICEMYGCQCMILHKGNKPHLCIRDDLFSCREPHHHKQLKEKKQVLQCTNSTLLRVNGVSLVLQHSLAKPQHLVKKYFKQNPGHDICHWHWHWPQIILLTVV